MRILSNPTWQDALSFALSLGTLIVIVAVLLLLGRSTLQHKIDISPISVPKKLVEEEGYGSDVASRRLLSELNKAIAQAQKPAVSQQTQKVASPRSHMVAFVSPRRPLEVNVASDLATITVPGLGTTLDAISTTIQDFFGVKVRKTISGEFTITENRLWLVLRLDHDEVFANKEGGDLDHPDALLAQGAVYLRDALNPELGGKAHVDAGNARDDEGKPDEAIAEYRTAIGLDPKDAAAHTNLGRILSDQGKLDEAVVEFSKAIQLEPKDAIRHIDLGNALSDQNKLDEAIAEYRTAIALDPKNAEPHIDLGNALGNQHKLDDAVAEFRTAIRLDSKDPYAHAGLGLALSDQDKLDDAIAELRTAVNLDPKNSYAYGGLGAALVRQGKLSEAIAQYRTAIDVDPKNGYGHASLGLALREQGKLVEAIAEFRAAIRLDPKDAETHTYLGIALSDQGKPDEAIAEFRTAIGLDPTFAYAVLWLYLGRTWAHQNGGAELTENSAKLDKGKWPVPIVDFYLKAASVDEVFQKAKAGDEKAQRGQVCEADFYLGSLALAQDRVDEGVARLHAAANGCPHEFTEWPSVRAELKRVGQ